MSGSNNNKSKEAGLPEPQLKDAQCVGMDVKEWFANCPVHLVIGSIPSVSDFRPHNDGNEMIASGNWPDSVDVMPDRLLPNQENTIVRINHSESNAAKGTSTSNKNESNNNHQAP